MIFGADSSGSTFLTPILEMRRQGIDVSDVVNANMNHTMSIAP